MRYATSIALGAVVLAWGAWSAQAATTGAAALDERMTIAGSGRGRPGRSADEGHGRKAKGH